MNTDKPKAPKCAHCGGKSRSAKGLEIYPHLPELAERNFWKCDLCQAWVGCHKGTKTPLGTPANKELRNLRKRAHAALDPLWQGKPDGTRSKVYAWLASEMYLSKEKCHIGLFTAAQCTDAINHIRRIQPA